MRQVGALSELKKDMSRWQSVLQGRLVEDIEEALYALKVFALPACNAKSPPVRATGCTL